jgi:hypothetical protein
MQSDMSIASEITRLQEAKEDIKDAIEAKGVTVPSSAKIDDYATLIGQISGGGGGSYDFVYKIKKGEQTTLSAQEAAILDTIPTTFQYRFGSLFRNTDIVSADLSPITNMGRYGGDFMFAISNIQTVNLSGLTESGSGGMYNMFNTCKSLTSLSLPELTKLEASINICDGCISLVSFSAPKLATVTGGVGAALRNCNSLKSVTIHPNALNNSGATNNLLGYATGTNFTALRLSAEATDNVYLSWQGSLDSDSILDVLNHLSTEATGKTCAFKNLTVDSSDPNYAAISAKKASLTNWTITGLTI